MYPSYSQAVGMSEGVSVKAGESQEVSEEKHQAAEVKVQQVEEDLQPQLDLAKHDVNTLRDMNRYISDSLTVIDRWVRVYMH